jgi:hypothetical protein
MSSNETQKHGRDYAFRSAEVQQINLMSELGGGWGEMDGIILGSA